MSLDTEGAASRAAVENGSPFASLRAQRDQARTRRTKDIGIPGYDTLVARYRVLTWDESDAINTRTDRQPNVSAQELAQACVGLFDMADGEVEVSDGYNERFAKALGFLDELSGRSAEEVVFATFPDEWAVVEHHGVYLRWMKDARLEADQEALGES